MQLNYQNIEHFFNKYVESKNNKITDITLFPDIKRAIKVMIKIYTSTLINNENRLNQTILVKED